MQAVIDYLKQNQSRFVDQLCEYVRFPSVSAQPQHRQDLQACAQWVVNHCQGIGLETRLCATQGNPVVVAKTPHKPPAERGGRRSEDGGLRSEVGPTSDLRPLTSDPGRVRQQRPEPGASQGGRGLPEHRHRAAVRHYVCHRRRRGGGQQQPGDFSA